MVWGGRGWARDGLRAGMGMAGMGWEGLGGDGRDGRDGRAGMIGDWGACDGMDVMVCIVGRYIHQHVVQLCSAHHANWCYAYPGAET